MGRAHGSRSMAGDHRTDKSLLSEAIPQSRCRALVPRGRDRQSGGAEARTAAPEQSARAPRSWRKWEQAGVELNRAREGEDFQAIGMRCRESLIAFALEAAGIVPKSTGRPLPKAADFVGWSEAIADTICPGPSGEARTSVRHFLGDVSGRRRHGDGQLPGRKRSGRITGTAVRPWKSLRFQVTSASAP